MHYLQPQWKLVVQFAESMLSHQWLLVYGANSSGIRDDFQLIYNLPDNQLKFALTVHEVMLT